jgi:FMN-dependent NADH-azoreductase
VCDRHYAFVVKDTLVAELQHADNIVIGAPVYNFGVPSVLKAWIDQIVRAGLIFNYTENGPVGLLEGKRAIVAMASAGMPIGSEIDFASGYLRHILGFIGITDVQIIAADQLRANQSKAIETAYQKIAELSD